jgi:hypothetical protein
MIFGFVTTLVAAEQSADVMVTKDTAFTFYRSYHRLTKQPHLVAPLTGILCSVPPPERVEREKLETGPHYKTYIHLYANAIGDDAIRQKLETFPVGSIIVKEKLAADGSVDGVGGMIKRGVGFDAKGGDWEYFYSDKAAGFSSGRLQSCAGCHANAAATDHVFSVRQIY